MATTGVSENDYRGSDVWNHTPEAEQHERGT